MTWIPTITSAVDFSGLFFLWLVSITKAPGITLAFIVPGITRYSFFPLATWSSNMGRGFFNSNHSFSAWIIVTFSPSPSHQYNSFLSAYDIFSVYPMQIRTTTHAYKGKTHWPPITYLVFSSLQRSLWCTIKPSCVQCIHFLQRVCVWGCMWVRRFRNRDRRHTWPRFYPIDTNDMMDKIYIAYFHIFETTNLCKYTINTVRWI